MSDKTELPERIWLQPSEEEITWCQDKINDDDVEYVRADTIFRPDRVKKRIPGQNEKSPKEAAMLGWSE